MTGYLILFAIFLILIVALIIATRLYNKEKADRLKAEMTTEKLRVNIKILQDNVAAVKEIKKKRKKIAVKIKEASTDEEVMDCISDIISANNSRV